MDSVVSSFRDELFVFSVDISLSANAGVISLRSGGNREV